MNKSKLFTLSISLILALFILSSSIAVPILFRPFYYMEIDRLDISSSSSYDKSTIKEAYNDMLDFCLGLNSDFSTGALKWSDSGQAHFEDVRFLFILDIFVMTVSLIILLSLLIFKHKKRLYITKILGRGPNFWGSAVLLGLFILLGTYICIDFDGAFYNFHRLFFPGKSNWLFDPDKDQIINILPEEYFKDCAIFAIVLLILMSFIFILLDFHRAKK